MHRPTKFEEHRFVGDKRVQVVYDLDADDVDPDVIDELMESERFICFGPDTLAEARNRGYRLWKGHQTADA
ncbi:MAG: hypothetical protein ACXIVQ_03405 [Acidimicrobiales bacterium]